MEQENIGLRIDGGLFKTITIDGGDFFNELWDVFIDGGYL